MEKSDIKSNLTEKSFIRPAHFHTSILESIAEGIVVIGLDKRIIFVNKMAVEDTPRHYMYNLIDLKMNLISGGSRYGA